MDLRHLSPTSRASRLGRRAVLTATFAAAVAVTLPAGTAAALDVGFWMYDADQDGYVDGSAVDTNGDGTYDANLLDLTGNGGGDTWLLDTNQNGVVDHVGFDRAEDGHFEEWNVDLDENDVIEGTYVDQNGDGLPETMALTGPSNPTVDINWERDVCPKDPFFCMQWPTVGGNGTVVSGGRVDGVSIGAGLDSLGNAESLIGGL